MKFSKTSRPYKAKQAPWQRTWHGCTTTCCPKSAYACVYCDTLTELALCDELRIGGLPVLCMLAKFGQILTANLPIGTCFESCRSVNQAGGKQFLANLD